MLFRSNTIVHTFQDFGILGINETVQAENLVINNCGQANLGVNKNWETKNMEKPGTFAEDVPDKIDGGTPSAN